MPLESAVIPKEILLDPDGHKEPIPIDSKVHLSMTSWRNSSGRVNTEYNNIVFTRH